IVGRLARAPDGPRRPGAILYASWAPPARSSSSPSFTSFRLAPGETMGLLSPPATRRETGPPADMVNRVLRFVATVATGVVMGIEYWNPNKRVIPVLAALLIFGVAWRLSMTAAINVMVFLLPYPKGTVFGNTNLAFILIVLVIWLLRIALRMSPPARPSP